MIAAPPVEAGAVHDTTDDASLAEVAVTRVGTPGTVDGTAAAEAAEATDVPFTFEAVTVKVYDLPLVRLLTTHDVAVRAMHVYPTTV